MNTLTRPRQHPRPPALGFYDEAKTQRAPLSVRLDLCTAPEAQSAHGIKYVPAKNTPY